MASLLALAFFVSPDPALAELDVDDPGPQPGTAQTIPFVPKVKHPDGLTLLFNGARYSKIEPCGCRGRNLGGLDREATVMDAFRNATSASLAVDAGGFFREFVDENLRLQGWYLLQGLKALKYDVVNIGYPDMRHGIDVLQKLQKEMGLPFVSANIVASATKQRFFAPYKSFNVGMGGGKKARVCVLGVTAPNAGKSNPPEQQLPRRAAPLEIPPQPTASAGHPAVLPRLPSPGDPATHSWTIGGNVDQLLDPRLVGGAAAEAAAGGSRSPALDFALNPTTPTLTKGMYEVMDEVEALAPLVKEMRDKEEYDLIVLLAFAGPQRSRQIAERVPGIDVVVCGDAFQLYDPFFFGPTNNILWVAPEHDGRLIGKAEIAFDDDGTIRDKSAEMIPIDQHIPTVPALTSIIKAYKRDTQFLPPPRSRPLEKNFVGARDCASCHIKETQQWKTHKHSRAMAALVKKDMQFNPDCLRCHTVGYGQPGGFTDLRVSAFLSNVQCESCHGPGKEHVDEERKIAALKEAERLTATRTAKMNMHFDSKLCMQCHDPENDPHFDFSLDIKHVMHDSTEPDRTRATSSPMMMMGSNAASASQAH